MSNQIRYVLQIAGKYVAGAKVKQQLQRHVAYPVRTLADITLAAKQLGLPLWIFREPRKISYARSRYKKLCRYLGIGTQVAKEKKGLDVQGLAEIAPLMPIEAPQEQVIFENAYGELRQNAAGIRYVVARRQNGANQPRPARQAQAQGRAAGNPINNILDEF